MLNIEKLKAYSIPDTEMELSRRDTMLYALGVGMGADPVDYQQLQFVCRDRLKALPTMATILATPYAWIKRADVGFGGKSVHAGIEVHLHGELPVEGTFSSQNSITEILDKGPGNAAVVTISRKIYLQETSKLVAEIRNTNIFRGDGGFGGPRESAHPGREYPNRSPDLIVEMPTLPQQGLLYQLNGDYNLLHNDPETAVRQGFPRPILHGLCTFGVTGHALLKHVCDYDPSKIRAIGANFTKPVYPGEAINVRVWHENSGAMFQVVVPIRDNEIVLDRGFVEFAT